MQPSASAQIDAIIEKAGGWRGATLARLRALIKQAAPAVVEEVKWKKPSRPDGVPVWSRDGLVCVADTLKKRRETDVPQGGQPQRPEAAVQHASGEQDGACDRLPRGRRDRRVGAGSADRRSGGAECVAETRQRRVEVGVSKLRSGKRRSCCFDGAGCTARTRRAAKSASRRARLGKASWSPHCLGRPARVLRLNGRRSVGEVQRAVLVLLLFAITGA